MALRLKTKFHKSKRERPPRRRGEGRREKTLEQRAGVVGYNIWKAAFARFQNMEKAGFRFDSDDQILAVMTELVAFMVQITDRLVYEQLDETERKLLITGATSKLIETMENNLREAATEVPSDYRSRLIATLNQRFQDYAEFEYDDTGPGYGFLRYFGERVFSAMAGGDNKWAIEHVMEIEAPEILKLVKKSVGEVLGVRV